MKIKSIQTANFTIQLKELVDEYFVLTTIKGKKQRPQEFNDYSMASDYFEKLYIKLNGAES